MLTPLVHASAAVRWRRLPPLPAALGGQFTGTLPGRLIVAGGSYFGTPVWDGGRKQFVDTVYTLAPGETEWRLSGRLPRPVAAGGAVSTPDGLLCVGGQTPDGYTAECHRVRLGKKGLELDRLPDLPHRAALLSAACTGDTVYAAGGQESPAATAALRSFHALSLTGKWEGWRRLADLPAAGRILPVLVAAGADVYLMSGATLTGTAGAPARRRFLSDAWRYSDARGWTHLPPLPQPAQAAAGLFYRGRVLVFGGNDGSLAGREAELRDRHPGFSTTVHAYSPGSKRWSAVGAMPLSLVTSPAALFGDEFVIAGGEDRPAHRSAAVIAGRLEIETEE